MEKKNLETLQTDLEQVVDRPSQIKILAEFLLQKMGATSINKSKSSLEVIEEYDKLLNENYDFIPIIPKNTFIVNLSKISNEESSRINCPGRRQGYYLEKLVDSLEDIEKENPENSIDIQSTKQSVGLFNEKDLYPILKSWLFEKDFDRVADTSNYKKNGKWGNPDLVGLKIEDIYGRPDVEITTIEVKLTDDNWEQWIFESVAHTRFSNRSYFSFLYPENLLNKLDSKELKLYAEHFKIGILILLISGDKFLKVKQRKPVDINADDVRIMEYFQAPSNQTNIKFRKKFLSALDILELNKLYKFGEELD